MTSPAGGVRAVLAQDEGESVAITATSAAFAWPASARAIRRAGMGVALVAALLLAGYVGGLIGQRRVGVRSVVGLGYSTQYQISVKAGSWWYEVPLSVRWQSADGTWHEDGRPACLPPTGKVGPVRLGAVPVTQDNTGWRAVVWVSCKI